MGYSSHLVTKIAMEMLSESRYILARHALGIYACQLGVNLVWMSLFFGTRNPRDGVIGFGRIERIGDQDDIVFWGG